MNTINESSTLLATPTLATTPTLVTTPTLTTTTTLTTTPPILPNQLPTNFFSTFQQGSLGMTLEQSNDNNEVFIAKIIKDGQAFQQGLMQYSILITIDHVSVADWHMDEVIQMIIDSPRPIILEFQQPLPISTTIIPIKSMPSTLIKPILLLPQSPSLSPPGKIDDDDDDNYNYDHNHTVDHHNDTNNDNERKTYDSDYRSSSNNALSSQLRTMTFDNESPLGLQFRVVGDDDNHLLSFIDVPTIQNTNTNHGDTLVVGLDAGGQAETGGMIPNNTIIISIAGVSTVGKSYQEIFNLLAESKRPLNVQFKNSILEELKLESANNSEWSEVHSLGPSEDYDLPPIIMAIFETGPLGMTLQHDNDGYAIVTHIVEGGQAAANGIELNSTVCTVADTYINEMHFDDVIEFLLASPRPLKIGMQGPNHWAHHDPQPSQPPSQPSKVTWKFDREKVSDEIALHQHRKKRVTEVAQDTTSVLEYEKQLQFKFGTARRLKLVKLFNKMAVTVEPKTRRFKDRSKTGRVGRVPKKNFLKTFVKLGIPDIEIAGIIFDRIEQRHKGFLLLFEFLKWVEEGKNNDQQGSSPLTKSSSLKKFVYGGGRDTPMIGGGRTDAFRVHPLRKESSKAWD